MKVPFESWHPAITQRYSQRTFNGQRIDNGQLDRLEKLCKEFRPFRGARAVIVRSPPKGVFRGIIGSYGEIKGAPHLAAFIGDMETPEVQEATGYLGEGIILEATSMGLQTCWVGGFFRPEVLEETVQLEESEKVLSITPIGYGVSKKTARDRLMTGVMRSHRRKPLDDLLTQSNKPLPAWVTHSLEAARLAPSAANRQPWRFTIDSESILVSTAKVRGVSRISRRLDCGIAMLHIEVGAKASGVEGRWELLQDPMVAKFLMT